MTWEIFLKYFLNFLCPLCFYQFRKFVNYEESIISNLSFVFLPYPQINCQRTNLFFKGKEDVELEEVFIQVYSVPIFLISIHIVIHDCTPPLLLLQENLPQIKKIIIALCYFAVKSIGGELMKCVHFPFTGICLKIFTPNFKNVNILFKLRKRFW